MINSLISKPLNIRGINAAQQLRLIFAELGAPSISSSFVVPRVHKAFSELNSKKWRNQKNRNKRTWNRISTLSRQQSNSYLRLLS
jgi:NAD(P)H-dependent FMN reductase